MRRNRFLIIGYYGFRNAGDELMLARLLDMLREMQASADITVLSGNPDETVRLHQVATVPYFIHGRFKRWYTLLNAICKSDVIVFGGGTFLQDYGFRSWHPIAYYLKIVMVARLLNKRVAIIGAGAGPLVTSMGQRISRWIISASNINVMRDPDSVKLLKDIGCRSEILLGADLVTPVRPQPCDPKIGAKKKTGVSFFPFFSYVFNNDERQEQMNSEVAAFIKDLSCGNDVYFFCFQEDIDGADNCYAQYLAEHYAISFQTVLFSDGADQFVECINDMDYAIGMRYHFVLLALLAAVPTSAVAYHPKVTALMKELNLEHSVIDLEQFTAESALMMCKNQYSGGDTAALDRYLQRSQVNRAALEKLLTEKAVWQ